MKVTLIIRYDVEVDRLDVPDLLERLTEESGGEAAILEVLTGDHAANYQVG